MYKAIDINYSDLEPFLSRETINTHFNKHYMGYLNRLNDILVYLGYDFKYSKEDLVKHIDDFPIDYRDTILYNLGGVLNHEVYFSSLGLNGRLGGSLYDKLVKVYGSYDKFKLSFKNKANLLVGSGYTNLVLDKDGNLDIINTSNQDTVYSYGYVPLISLDLWEHAYYLDYKSDRGKYIDDFFSMIDFGNVNKKYEEAIKKI